MTDTSCSTERPPNKTATVFSAIVSRQSPRIEAVVRDDTLPLYARAYNSLLRPEPRRERKAVGGVWHGIQRLLGRVWCVALATLNLSQRVVEVKHSLADGVGRS